jgi:1-deoxy-D-xylulose-5-phosphate synthase
MLLDRITSPADLRRLDADELAQLATEIRDVIIERVNANGGHLGSNLGIVETTLALHRVFDSPHDTILFDTGHQAYVHKLVTGRQAAFHSLRKQGGMSGYPSRAESEHDVIENSHASTVLSYAHGLATAQELQGGPQHRIVAVIGDGALTGGMAYEGLNNLGSSGRNVVIVLNDNGRSYAPTVSRLSESLSRLRGNPTYRRGQSRVQDSLSALPTVGPMFARGVEGAKAAVRQMFEPPVFFEHLGVHYLGPIDGHDIELIESALRNAAEIDGPVVVHVLTQKGRGYGPAEEDDVKNLHDMGSIKDGSYTATFSQALIAAGERRPELVAITAAMPDSTGLLEFGQRFPGRLIDVGIAEQHGVTAAAGMAMGGLRPVVAVYSTFLSRAFDQLNLDVGLHAQPVVFVLDRAGITGDDGASHHGVLDMVLCTKVPGMTVFAPSSASEVTQMFNDALEFCTDGPSAIRFSKSAPPPAEDGDHGSGLSARRLRSGPDICLIGVGKMLAAARAAADQLAEQGTEVTVWDPRVVKPLDPELVHDAARHQLVVTIEDGLRDGGVGQSIADALRDVAPGRGPSVRVLGVPSAFIPHGNVDAILSQFGLDADGVLAEVAAWQTAMQR